MTALTLRRSTHKARFFSEDLGDGINLDMTLILAGDFWMGTPDDEIEQLCQQYEVDYFRRESPQHFVSVPKFYLGRYPITQGQYQAVMEKNPSRFKKDFQESRDSLQRPVEQVSWDDAQEFCKKLSDLTGKPYRLPTEAEWEYACRGVIAEEQAEALTQEIWNEKYYQPFHFGETISAEIANYDASEVYGSGEKGEYREQTTPVGLLGVANRFGLYDMHGNVWEWCEDNDHETYKNAPSDGGAWLEKNSKQKIRRGGSWYSYPRYCRSAFRLRRGRGYGNDYFGFRVAVSPQ